MKNNAEKITPSYCAGRKLVFYPETQEEAAAIQRRILSMGMRWRDGDASVAELPKCVEQGLTLVDGKMGYNAGAAEGYLRCAIDQLGEDYVPPDRAFLLEQFGKIAQRLDALAGRVERLEKDVGDIRQEVLPQEISKPCLKKPDAAP